MGAWGRFEGSRGRLVAKTRAEKSVGDDVAKLPNPSHQADRRQAGFARLNPPGVQIVGLMCARMMKATRRITDGVHGRSLAKFLLDINLIKRTVERELIPMAKALNLGLVAWSPSLVRPHRQYNDAQKTGEARFSNESMRQLLPERERQESIVAVLRKVSTETGRSLAQVALAWLRCRNVDAGTGRGFGRGEPGRA